LWQRSAKYDESRTNRKGSSDTNRDIPEIKASTGPLAVEEIQDDRNNSAEEKAIGLGVHFSITAICSCDEALTRILYI
jgi:hypothetical protein